jgi:flagellar motor switch protein FliM
MATERSEGNSQLAATLSQEEINALVETYKAAGGPEEAGRGGERRVRLYDFARPDKFSKEHIRALSQINARYGTSLAVALATQLRVEVQVNLLALEQLTYREFLTTVPEDTLFVEVGLEPLSALSVFEFNPSLVAACVDLLAGGNAVSIVQSSTISEIDKAVMHPVVDTALKQYAEAWAGTVVLKPRVISLTTESTTRQVLLPSEGVVVGVFEVTVANFVSMASICIPASAIEAVLPALASRRAMNASSHRSDAVNEALRDSFDQVEVECTAVLGRTALSVQEVADLEVGDLIRLPVKTKQDAEIWVENLPVYAGPLGRSGQNLAIKIARKLDED